MLDNGDKRGCLDNETHSETECESKNRVVKIISSG